MEREGAKRLLRVLVARAYAQTHRDLDGARKDV